MEAQPREIRRYIAPDGKVPFGEWLDSLRDRKAGVFELRIDYSSGYRVYFGQIGLTIVLLLLGGDKSTQEQDIRRTTEYWADYEESENSDQ